MGFASPQEAIPASFGDGVRMQHRRGADNGDGCQSDWRKVSRSAGRVAVARLRWAARHRRQGVRRLPEESSQGGARPRRRSVSADFFGLWVISTRKAGSERLTGAPAPRPERPLDRRRQSVGNAAVSGRWYQRCSYRLLTLSANSHYVMAGLDQAIGHTQYNSNIIAWGKSIS